MIRTDGPFIMEIHSGIALEDKRENGPGEAGPDRDEWTERKQKSRKEDK